MTSTNFVYQDAVSSARKQFADDAGRRWSDGDIEILILPRVLQQLRADRPDAFIGAYTGLNLKPSLADPCVFDDALFNAFVEAIVAAVTAVDEESVASGQSAGTDALSERARRR
jgi:hypothetical protein